MDYKYIKQLLQRYWQGDTSLEEEEILRMFFSQKDVPAELRSYRELFAYQQSEVKEDVLDEAFDARITALIEEPAPVKARLVTLPQRLRPLFKAAAVVAILLTLGNAMQVPFGQDADPYANAGSNEYNKVQHGTSVAMGDSSVIDTLQQSSIQPTATPTIIK
ncbi:pyruvate ferredoxin oxidoreductase [Prevotella sp. kh1p2]|uniref:pyruvate ferredoxin oxidoreductase n=1 Tax=Prevotella sp. kh1p2 TaxID=1761883 RepID=UPI0008CE880D|nr:pyruvate ferredoxin oxidoreductase [Prevotella sp. kh1p2]SET20301.1 hypothetical protein SAMN04487825_12011 [Prevotella sp. kh1p2]SNU12272.1 hypothetical protein SAMN06298210_12133 [Prevotellaceae bacterium KH2P17]